MSNHSNVVAAATKLDKAVKEAEGKLKVASSTSSVFNYHSWQSLTTLRKESEALAQRAQVNSHCFAENLANLREFVDLWRKINGSIGQCIESLTQDAVKQGYVPRNKASSGSSGSSSQNIFPESFDPDFVVQVNCENDKENIPSIAQHKNNCISAADASKLTLAKLKPPARVSNSTTNASSEISKSSSVGGMINSPMLPPPTLRSQPIKIDSPELPAMVNRTSPGGVKTPVLALQGSGFFSDLQQFDDSTEKPKQQKVNSLKADSKNKKPLFPSPTLELNSTKQSSSDYNYSKHQNNASKQSLPMRVMSSIAEMDEEIATPTLPATVTSQSSTTKRKFFHLEDDPAEDGDDMIHMHSRKSFFGIQTLPQTPEWNEVTCNFKQLPSATKKDLFPAASPAIITSSADGKVESPQLPQLNFDTNTNNNNTQTAKRRKSIWIEEQDYEILPESMKRTISVEQANAAMHSLRMEREITGKKLMSSKDIQSATMMSAKTSALILLLIQLQKLRSVPNRSTYETLYELVED